MNPMQLIQMLRSGQNPQQLAMNLLESQMGETPMGQNLLNLAKNGRSADIEQIARNLAKQQGIDFDLLMKPLHIHITPLSPHYIMKIWQS